MNQTLSTVQFQNSTNLKPPTEATPASSSLPPTPPPVPKLGYNDDDSYLDFDDDTSVFLKVGAVLWLLFMVFCFKKERELEVQREERAERRRVRREARRAARAAKKRRLDPQRRMQDIKAAIVTRMYTQHDAQQCPTTLEATSESSEATTDNDDKTCSICLDEFTVGSELSWSKELHCRHVFHKECLMPWLMKHDDCPVCRTPLLIDHDATKLKPDHEGNGVLDDDDDDDEDDDDEGHIGRFQIVNGLVSYVRQTGLSILQSRSGESEQRVEVNDDDDDEIRSPVTSHVEDATASISDTISRSNSMDEEVDGHRQENDVTNDSEGDDGSNTRPKSQKNRRRLQRRYQSVGDVESGGLSIDQEDGNSDEEIVSSGRSRKKYRKVGGRNNRYRPITGVDDPDHDWTEDNEQCVDDRFVISDGDD